MQFYTVGNTAALTYRLEIWHFSSAFTNVIYWKEKKKRFLCCETTKQDSDLLNIISDTWRRMFL